MAVARRRRPGRRLHPPADPRPEKYVVGLVVVLLAVAAVEFYDTVREQGLSAGQFVGLAAGDRAAPRGLLGGRARWPLVLVLAFVATSLWFMASGSIDSGPLPNAAITMLGVVYIGISARSRR